MLQGNAKGYVKMIFARYKEIGYRPQLFLVNAADCGVPQKRERVFFCAIREDLDRDKLVLAPKHRWISAGKATADVQDLTAEEIQDTLPTLLDLQWWGKTIGGDGGGYATAIEREGGKRKAFGSIKLAENRPANTLMANYSKLTHWAECRKLTYREWKRLGSFPDDYQAKTDKIGKYMIGMSVPPKMTEAVARAVIEQWLT